MLFDVLNIFETCHRELNSVDIDDA